MNLVSSYVTPGVNAKPKQKNDFAVRNQLSQVLFNKPLSKQVRFGWSAHATKNVVEKNILDLLTSPNVKTAITAAHARPDGDAYGSSIGLAGILKNQGKKVYTAINDFPAVQFSKMPSPKFKKVDGQFVNVPATRYVSRPDSITRYMQQDHIDRPDVGIVSDCAVPNMTQNSLFEKVENKTLDLIAKAKKVVVIDHHPDSPNSPTNKEIWTSALNQRGVDSKDVLYWREIRESASEMVGELDKEIKDESKKGVIKYNDSHPAYRLATASGIFTDAGGAYKNGDLKLSRYSKPMEVEKDHIESPTGYYMKWLLNNSGENPKNVNLRKFTSLEIPDHLHKAMKDVMNNKVKVEGVDIKAPSQESPLGIIHIKNNNFFKTISDEINESGINNFKLRPGNIAKEFKEEAQSLNRDKNMGVLLMVTDINKGEKSFVMSTRSYGVESANGDLAEKGHIINDGAAKRIVNALNEAGVGTGGGHANACGFKSFDGKDFMKDAYPIIQKVLAEDAPQAAKQAMPQAPVKLSEYALESKRMQHA